MFCAAKPTPGERLGEPKTLGDVAPLKLPSGLGATAAVADANNTLGGGLNAAVKPPAHGVHDGVAAAAGEPNDKPVEVGGEAAGSVTPAKCASKANPDTPENVPAGIALLAAAAVSVLGFGLLQQGHFARYRLFVIAHTEHFHSSSLDANAIPKPLHSSPSPLSSLYLENDA